MPALPIYVVAAAAEIAGCFAVWMWLRQGRSALWLGPGVLSLLVFAALLAASPAAQAGRAYAAACGEVYVAASLAWLWAVEGSGRTLGIWGAGRSA